MHASNRRFARHYIEMVAVMFAGMGILWLPASLALYAAGLSSAELHADAPALLLLVMAVTMTAPMVAWMRYRGHAWRPSAEMVAAMFVPTLAAIALLAVSLVESLGTLMAIEHVAMLLAMLGAMLVRRDEYAHGAHAHARRGQSRVAATA
jgi:hypothetical protein